MYYVNDIRYHLNRKKYACNKNVLANSLRKLSQEKIIQMLKVKLYGGGGG